MTEHHPAKALCYSDKCAPCLAVQLRELKITLAHFDDRAARVGLLEKCCAEYMKQRDAARQERDAALSLLNYTKRRVRHFLEDTLILAEEPAV